MLTIQIICILFFFYFTFFWMENILVQYLLNSSFIDSAFFLIFLELLKPFKNIKVVS